MNESLDLVPLKHQALMMTLPFKYRGVSWFLLVGGYGAAKSFSDVFLILEIARYYEGYQVRVGLGSTNIVFFMKTIGADLERVLAEGGIKYRFDGQENCYIIGTVKFYVIPMDQPTNVYGYSFNAFIDDEGDERSQDKFLAGAKAIKERCRVPFPSVTPEEKQYQAMYKERMKIVPREQWNTDELINEWKYKAHRPPFAAFTSTAQGRKGFYRLYLDLKERNEAFILIRAKTIDNVYNDPTYYQNLYNIYTENERRAFLDGEFVSLTDGMCYPSFDEETMVVDDFEPGEHETVLVGQDTNLNASCGVGFVKRDGVLYAVKSWMFKDFTNAASVIRKDLPTQRIPYYPDNASKMLMNALMASFVQNNIEVSMGGSNPPINERIFIVNLLMRMGKLKICRGVKELIMCWKTRAYDEKTGMPSKARVHPEPSDWADSSEYCLYRIVSDDPDFYDVYSLSNHGRGR